MFLLGQYGLSQVQAEKIRKYVRSKGATFVREKMAVVDREPRPNVARTLLAALRDDWQLPVKSGSSKPKAEQPLPINEEIRSKQAAEFAKFKESLRVG